jgi:hypothetical protein
MATTEPAFQKVDPPGRGSVFTWTATVLACAYVLWSGTMLYLSTPKFIDMYSSMGVELSLPTRIVIATYRFGYPLWFGGANSVGNRKAVLRAREVAQPEHCPGGRCNGGYHQSGNRLGVIPSSV